MCLNRKDETNSTRGRTIKDFVWAKQSWPIGYYIISNKEKIGIYGQYKNSTLQEKQNSKNQEALTSGAPNNKK